MFLKKWMLKYFVQKCLSLLPFGLGLRANHYLQTRCGGLKDPVIYGLPRTLTMVWALEQCGGDVRGRTFVELGTGWDGSSALTLLSMGAARVESFDVVRHLDPALHQTAVRLIAERRDYHEKQRLPFAPDYDELMSRCGAVDPEAKGFVYRAPADGGATSLASESIDVYYSLAVLEHVPEATLLSILQESFRIMRPGGLCYHYVQPTMHAAAFDHAAVGVDYLQCSELVWNTLFANSLSYENRLRAVDYLRLLERVGFRIRKSWHTVDEVSLRRLPQLRVDKQFTHYSDEELATDYLWVVAEK
jgi:SAM-dependent methyltransferase